MRIIAILFLSVLAVAQEPNVRREHWGMTKNQVIAAERSAPLKRSSTSLLYRGKESGIPARVHFLFTNGKLDQVTFFSEAENPETAFLTWCLALTKSYGRGEVYLNKTPIGRPGLVLDEVLTRFWKQNHGEILVVFPPKDTTYAGLGITLSNGNAVVEMDYANKPEAAF